jgi:hypothetical protein
MKTTWLARRLGLDGNPLRRRSDRIAIYLGILLVAAFLIGAPPLSGAAIGWAGHAGAAEPRAGHTGHRIPAVRMSAGLSVIPRSWPGRPHLTCGRGPVILPWSPAKPP